MEKKIYLQPNILIAKYSQDILCSSSEYENDSFDDGWGKLTGGEGA